MEDEDIIGLYWDRSQQAIAESERKYGAYCMTVARNILERREDAEECVSDTWLHAWNAIPPQRPRALQAFFGRVTRNLALDRWRRLRAARRGGGQVEISLTELEECLPDPHGPEQVTEARETARIISAFLRRQSDLDRRLFLRRYYCLESCEDLAAFFHLTRKQTASRLARIRKRLREELEKEGIYP